VPSCIPRTIGKGKSFFIIFIIWGIDKTRKTTPINRAPLLIKAGLAFIAIAIVQNILSGCTEMGT